MAFSRRSFLKISALALSSLPFLSKLLSPEALAAEELPMAKEGVEPAKSLKYCANASKPDKNCEARKHKDKAKQFCYNCQLYTKGEGDKKTGKGKCMIMPKNRVAGGGWCMSWVQNPAVKD